MTTFTVTFHDGGEQTFTGAFNYEQGGVLRVTSDGKRTHYSPTAWTKVVHDAPDGRVHGQ